MPWVRGIGESNALWTGRGPATGRIPLALASPVQDRDDIYQSGAGTMHVKRVLSRPTTVTQRTGGQQQFMDLRRQDQETFAEIGVRPEPVGMPDAGEALVERSRPDFEPVAVHVLVNPAPLEHVNQDVAVIQDVAGSPFAAHFGAGAAGKTAAQRRAEAKNPVIWCHS